MSHSATVPASRAVAARRGFTLMELLVVITIIATLLSMLFPVMGMVRESARSADCLANLRQLGTGMHAFSADNGGDLMPHDVGAYWGYDWYATGYPRTYFNHQKYQGMVWAATDFDLTNDSRTSLLPPYVSNMRSSSVIKGTSRSAFVCKSSPSRLVSYAYNAIPFSEGNPGITPALKYPGDAAMQWATYLKQCTTTGSYAVWWDGAFNNGNGRATYRLPKLAEISTNRAMLWDSWGDKTYVDHATPAVMVTSNPSTEIWHKDRKLSLWFIDGRVKRGTRTQAYYSAIYPSSPLSGW